MVTPRDPGLGLEAPLEVLLQHLPSPGEAVVVALEERERREPRERRADVVLRAEVEAGPLRRRGRWRSALVRHGCGRVVRRC